MGTMDGPQTPSPCVSAGANNGGSTRLLNDFAPSICQRVPQRPLRFSARSVPCGWSALPFVRKGDTERSFGTARAVWRLLGTFWIKKPRGFPVQLLHDLISGWSLVEWLSDFRDFAEVLWFPNSISIVPHLAGLCIEYEYPEPCRKRGLDTS